MNTDQATNATPEAVCSTAMLGPSCRSEMGDVMLCPDAACGWLGRCVAAEPMEPVEERDCQHGQLARACDRCADAREIAELRARVLELEAQCEAGAASEQRWIDWLVRQGLLHYHQLCHRPDRTHGPAWVLRRPRVIDGDSCEAWSAQTAADALREFLRA